jgi:hypothetical protein
MDSGTRVGALVATNNVTKEVQWLGEGTYMGEEVPDVEPFKSIGLPNPKIKLDNDKVVWGYQCWWGELDKIKAKYEGWKFVETTL